MREVRHGDLAGCVQLLVEPEVRSYLGGPLPLERAREVARDCVGRAGVFAVTAADTFVGTVVLNRRDRARPGRRDLFRGDALEVSYTLLPEHWGHGHAGEAVGLVLDWAAAAVPDDLVVICTQSANARSVALAERLGFAEVARFEEFAAEQWFGVRALRGVPSTAPS